MPSSDPSSKQIRLRTPPAIISSDAMQPTARLPGDDGSDMDRD